MSNLDRATTPDRLISGLLLEDPEMLDLVEQFVESLTDRLTEFCRAHDQLDWDQLATLAHQLKGAGGSYGYPDLSDLGATMEAGFRAHSADRFANWMAQLEEIIGAARKGLQVD